MERKGFAFSLPTGMMFTLSVIFRYEQGKGHADVHRIDRFDDERWLNSSFRLFFYHWRSFHFTLVLLDE